MTIKFLTYLCLTIGYYNILEKKRDLGNHTCKLKTKLCLRFLPALHPKVYFHSRLAIQKVYNEAPPRLCPSHFSFFFLNEPFPLPSFPLSLFLLMDHPSPSLTLTVAFPFPSTALLFPSILASLSLCKPPP
ncbi:hypothetical protein VNO78_21182 [Psophocarpus tetragonolobus]|uniref:Uncharacterized protein n=1 Tax=Psophocarpus tetragonolobus TaxID=3891 RepID=A0AAN9XHY3_PSOTE